MHPTLSKALVAPVPTGILFVGSLVLFLKRKDAGLFPAAARRRISGDGRSHPSLRRASSVSWDALGRSITPITTATSGMLFLV
jgi:hypothetical protein